MESKIIWGACEPSGYKCQTQDQEIGYLNITGAVLCFVARHSNSPYNS